MNPRAAPFDTPSTGIRVGQIRFATVQRGESDVPPRPGSHAGPPLRDRGRCTVLIEIAVTAVIGAIKAHWGRVRETGSPA
jgi:hypothetical protein